MFAQISAFFDNVFSKYQCGFWNYVVVLKIAI